MQEFQSTSKRWHSCSAQISGQVGKWYYIPRKMGIDLIDWIKILKDEYNAVDIKYCIETDCLIYSFTIYADCHKFTLWVNREARKGGW